MKTIDLAIIGGGPAGGAAAERAARNGLSVTLFEKNALGGVCLHEGCIPTKTLLMSAKLFDYMKQAVKYGVECGPSGVDFAKIIGRKNKIIRKLNAGIRKNMSDLQVEVIMGEARIAEATDSHILIACNDEMYQAGRLLICTGSESVVPPIPGLSETPFWTNREALKATECPESLVIIGGGVIGMEFASFFNSLGSRVQVIEMADEILGGMDKEFAGLLREEYARHGVVFHLGSKVTAIEENRVKVVTPEGEMILTGQKILLSVGRKPVLEGFGLDVLGLERWRNGIKVSENMQTSHPLVYACGDVTGFSLLAHTASREAEVAVNHILDIPDRMSYSAIPGVVYTHPEFAGTGATEEQLQAKGIPYQVKRISMAYSGRFVAENEGENGWCKILVADDNTVLGAHLLGGPAAEMITAATMAIGRRLTLTEWSKTVFPHPTVSEIMKDCILS